MSYQIFDLSSPDIDLAIARTSDSLIAAETDNQLLNGSATSGQTTGINGISGATSTLYTDASPTQQELLPIVAQNWSAVMNARGIAPNVAVMHNRRWAWLTAGQDATTTRPLYLGELGDADDIPRDTSARRRVSRRKGSQCEIRHTSPDGTQRSGARRTTPHA